MPEVGRGCGFCNSESECQAQMADGCFKLHETPWLADYPAQLPDDIVEVRFKNTRRSFYQNATNQPLKPGDIVAVEASPGHDIGIVTLTGDLVARQMCRTGFNPYNGEFKKVYRKAKPYDIERWQEAIALEHETMIAARQIAAEMGLNMKIGDVEYQGDKIKAIFYYIADERVDFRELIKVFAERFHIRIEMKQIGARQEAGRIGGLGACGRELCCASWMSSFSSVTTGAARAQDISLNPQKLAGQCSKLKCCMMYEYDTYVEARKNFPRLREPLQTVDGEYFLVKTDLLGGTMTFSSSKEAMANVVTLPVERVKAILALNRAGTKVERLQDESAEPVVDREPAYTSGSEEDSITRFDSARRRKKNRNNRSSNGRSQQQSTHPNRPPQGESAASAAASDAPAQKAQTEPAAQGGQSGQNGQNGQGGQGRRNQRNAANNRNHAEGRRNNNNNNGNTNRNNNRRGGNPNNGNGRNGQNGRNGNGSNNGGGPNRSGGANPNGTNPGGSGRSGGSTPQAADK